MVVSRCLMVIGNCIGNLKSLSLSHSHTLCRVPADIHANPSPAVGNLGYWIFVSITVLLHMFHDTIAHGRVFASECVLNTAMHETSFSYFNS
jgi:hypothetical protein